jgi:hypothetical protein
MLIVHSGQSLVAAAFVPLQHVQQAADRQHHDVVDHQGGDQERQHVGQERAVGEPHLAHLPHQIPEVGRAADQRKQRVDERRDELLDQVAELGADHHRHGELHQVPAHDEVLEARHRHQVSALAQINHGRGDPPVESAEKRRWDPNPPSYAVSRAGHFR